jgi:E3 Ubiquitin ligase
MLWIGGIVLLVVAAGLLVATFSEKRRFALLATTERSTAAELNAMAAAVAAEIGAGSFHQIAEVAGTTRCQQPLTSELTSTPCVHYQMSVTREYEETYYETDDKNQRVRRERRGSETVAENRRSCSFEVEDATGRVTVDPRDAKIIPEKVCDRFDSGDPHTPKLEIGSWKLDLSALTVREGRRTLGFRYEERIVPIDRAIFVLGEASDRSGQLVIGKPARKGATFLVSTKSEEALLADARSNARWLLTGTIVAALAGAVLVLVGLLR